MSDVVLLSRAQMARLAPHFPRSRGKPRVDDRRVVCGIIYVIRNGMMWKDAPRVYGPHKTLYNRFIRWSRMGVFERIFAALAADAGTGLLLGPCKVEAAGAHNAVERDLSVGGVDDLRAGVEGGEDAFQPLEIGLI